MNILPTNIKGVGGVYRKFKGLEATGSTSFTRSEGMREGAVIEPGERERE